MNIETQEKRFTKGKKGSRAYIDSDGNDMESSEESKSEEANLCLLVNHNEDDLLDEDMVNDFEPSNYSFDEFQDAYNELREKSMIIVKELVKTKKGKGVLNDKIDILSRDIIKMRQVQISFGSVQYECKSCLMNTPPTCTSCDD
jgi:hypothetical protein